MSSNSIEYIEYCELRHKKDFLLMLTFYTFKKTLMTFTLGIMLLLWIISYPISVIASDECQNCCDTCQCPKASESVCAPKTHLEHSSCGDLSTCLQKSSVEFPYSIEATNHLDEKQTRYDGIVPTTITVRSNTLEHYIEYTLYSIETPLYITYSQYRSPPSI
jgi:hypothetical protein